MNEKKIHCRILTFLFAVACLLPSGCETGPQARRTTYVKKNPTLSRQTRQAILNGKIELGMSEQDVMASWGKPSRIEKKRNDFGGYTCWVYEKVTQDNKKRAYKIFFEDNKVSSLDQRILGQEDYSNTVNKRRR